jgi:hypothetical protein
VVVLVLCQPHALLLELISVAQDDIVWHLHPLLAPALS